MSPAELTTLRASSRIASRCSRVSVTVWVDAITVPLVRAAPRKRGRSGEEGKPTSPVACLARRESLALGATGPAVPPARAHICVTSILRPRSADRNQLGSPPETRRTPTPSPSRTGARHWCAVARAASKQGGSSCRLTFLARSPPRARSPRSTWPPARSPNRVGHIRAKPQSLRQESGVSVPRMLKNPRVALSPASVRPVLTAVTAVFARCVVRGGPASLAGIAGPARMLRGAEHARRLRASRNLYRTSPAEM